METRASRVAKATSPASQAAPIRNLGISNTRAKAKVEAGRSRKATARKAQVSRTRAVLVGHSRIRAADSLGTATSVTKRATGQQTAHRKGKCKP